MDIGLILLDCDGEWSLLEIDMAELTNWQRIELRYWRFA